MYEYEFLGWYSSGVDAKEADMEIQKQVTSRFAAHRRVALLKILTLLFAHTHTLSLAFLLQFLEYNESPFYLLFNPNIPPTARNLPISIYETELRIIMDQPTLIFSKTAFKIESLDAERVAVDHVAHLATGGGAVGSQLMIHLMSMKSATNMLALRVKIIIQVLSQMKDGKLELDHSILREVASLCNRLPALNTGAFREDFLNVRID